MSNEQLVSEAFDALEQGLMRTTGMTLGQIREISRGQQRARAGLTMEEINTIRQLADGNVWSQADLADIYGVHPSTVSRIVNNPRYMTN